MAAKKERFLTVDIGSTAVHVAEFETSASGLTLQAFEFVEYSETMNDQNRAPILIEALRTALDSGKFTTKTASVCISGQASFMRFVKLPPVADDDQGSVDKIVKFEAKQNVPFPIEEVVWDYQLIGNEDDEDDLEVMFAVVKNEIVETINNAMKQCGLKPRYVDFSPAALYNAARANYIGENSCDMLLNIGGKCTTLLFMEGSKFFARSIPIAGATITQQISKEFSVDTDEAETLKRRFGFVALGGAYEEPESEVAATISKIVRNVMTRLHGEINRTINIYRSQQKGSKPTRLLLAGGSSTMLFTNNFFSEKLRMEVDYFNAFQIVNTGNVDTEELSQVAHLFPETVGVALRHISTCPIDINLTTGESKAEDNIRSRQPYIMAACAVWLLIFGVVYMVNLKAASLLKESIKEENVELGKLDTMKSSIMKTEQIVASEQKKVEAIEALMDNRYNWTEFMNALQDAKPIDVWITSIKPMDKTPKTAAPKKSTPFGPAITAQPKKQEKAGSNIAEWFTITGYRVKIPMKDKNNRFTRPIFTEAQKVSMENQQTKYRDNLKKGDEMPTLDFMGNNRITDKTELASIFEKSLQFSPYFAFSKEETKILDIDFSLNSTFENLAKFEIQVRLSKPIPLVRK